MHQNKYSQFNTKLKKIFSRQCIHYLSRKPIGWDSLTIKIFPLTSDQLDVNNLKYFGLYYFCFSSCDWKQESSKLSCEKSFSCVKVQVHEFTGVEKEDRWVICPSSISDVTWRVRLTISAAVITSSILSLRKLTSPSVQCFLTRSRSCLGHSCSFFCSLLEAIKWISEKVQ